MKDCNYVKRTQKDYAMSFKLSVVQDPEQKLLELEAKVRLLEKQKNRLEDQLKRSDDKAIIFDMMIDIAEKEYNIPIKKTYYPSSRDLQGRTPRKYNLQLWVVRKE